MNNVFELYLTSDSITKEQWERFYKIITQHIGKLANCQLIIAFEDNIIRFFVASQKDLGLLSNNIEIGVLRPVTLESIGLPKTSSKQSLVRFVTGGNLIDLKEKMAVKRAQQLEFIIFNLKRVNDRRSWVKAEFYFKDAANQWFMCRKTLTLFPAHLLAIDFEVNAKYIRKTPPKYLSIEKTVQLFDSGNANAIFSINTFPYFSKDYFLPLNNYEFDKHSFIIGATGSGKSKLIQLYIDRLAKSQLRMNYRVIVIDPHDSLRHDLEGLQETHIINFANESAELFGGEIETDVTAATELTTSLMKSLLADQFNARLERVLRFSLFVLFTAQTMSLGFLKRFLTELELRNQVLEHVGSHTPTNIQKFFVTDYNEIRTTYYNEAILPIVALVDEMQLQPTLVAESEQSLARLIQSNFLNVFSLNKVSMGEKVVKTVAGLLIQQIFLLAQARAFNEKVILIIDEVSIIQNPALASILAEARKFNLSVILTQQYFGQIEKDLRDAIFANVYNYYVFHVSEKDAEALSGNLTMEIPKEIAEAEKANGIKEEQLKIKYMTDLHPRECLLRLSANGQILPVFKARTMDIESSQTVPAAKAKNLVAYKKSKPKPSKFVEDSETKTFEKLPQQTSAPSRQPIQPIPAQPIELPQAKDSTTEEFFGAGLNPEAEITIFKNPEIDAAVRQAKQHEIEQSASKIGAIVTSKLGENESKFMQPTMNLSELLASQSANREN